MQVLPGLNYAETEVDQCPPKQQGALCELVEQHLQSYATLNPPGTADGSSREACCFQEQYDNPEMLNHIYSTFKCGKVKLQRLQNYLAQPEAYTLPLVRAMGLLAVAQEEQGEAADNVGGFTCVQRGRPAVPKRRRVWQGKKKKVSQPASPAGLEQVSGIEEQPALAQAPPPRRKGFGYGLKTIITDCGRGVHPPRLGDAPPRTSHRWPRGGERRIGTSRGCRARLLELLPCRQRPLTDRPQTQRGLRNEPRPRTRLTGRRWGSQWAPRGLLS